MKFNTIKADPSSGKPLGSRNDVVLKKLFSTSPLYQEPEAEAGLVFVDGYNDRLRLTEQGLDMWFFRNVVDSAKQQAGGAGVPGSGGYYGINGSYGMDFEGLPGNEPPDMNEVNTNKTGGGGKPATAFVPNPASPGADPNGGTNVNFKTIPESAEFAKQQNAKVPSTFGSGFDVKSGNRNPAQTSVKIGSSYGNALTLGKSLATPSGDPDLG